MISSKSLCPNFRLKFYICLHNLPTKCGIYIFKLVWLIAFASLFSLEANANSGAMVVRSIAQSLRVVALPSFAVRAFSNSGVARTFQPPDILRGSRDLMPFTSSFSSSSASSSAALASHIVNTQPDSLAIVQEGRSDLSKLTSQSQPASQSSIDDLALEESGEDEMTDANSNNCLSNNINNNVLKLSQNVAPIVNFQLAHFDLNAQIDFVRGLDTLTDAQRTAIVRMLNSRSKESSLDESLTLLSSILDCIVEPVMNMMQESKDGDEEKTAQLISLIPGSTFNMSPINANDTYIKLTKNAIKAAECAKKLYFHDKNPPPYLEKFFKKLKAAKASINILTMAEADISEFALDILVSKHAGGLFSKNNRKYIKMMDKVVRMAKKINKMAATIPGGKKAESKDLLDILTNNDLEDQAKIDKIRSLISELQVDSKARAISRSELRVTSNSASSSTILPRDSVSSSTSLSRDTMGSGEKKKDTENLYCFQATCRIVANGIRNYNVQAPDSNTAKALIIKQYPICLEIIQIKNCT